MTGRDRTLAWGLNDRQLHDAFWLEHGVRVVRRGAGARRIGTGRWYLLLESRDLVLANLTDAVRHLSRHQRLLALRLLAGDAQTFAERVETIPPNQLRAIHRQYATDARHGHSIFLTDDPDVAEAWGGSESTTTGIRRLRLAAGPHGVLARRATGRIYDSRNPEQQDACLRTMMMLQPDLPHRFPNTTKLAAGVWRHSSARVDRRARIVAPAWIGAGVVVEAEETLPGPTILPDRCPVAPPPKTHDATPARPLPTIPVHRAPNPAPLRRIMNTCAALLGIVVTLPLYPFIMLAILIEDGRPFFFAHVRQTRDGRDFTCHKFRTMLRNAERMKEKLAAENVCDGPQFHIENDPRLLKTGRFLRRFHLDEVPQFFDVLGGRMDLIGPRPSPDRENRFCPAWREARLSVNPGITGLWQVRRTRAPNTDFQEWIRYDLEYIDRRTWRLDFEIAFRTVMAMASGFVRRARRKPVPTSSAPSVQTEMKPEPIIPVPEIHLEPSVPAERASRVERVTNSPTIGSPPPVNVTARSPRQ